MGYNIMLRARQVYETMSWLNGIAVPRSLSYIRLTCLVAVVTTSGKDMRKMDTMDGSPISVLLRSITRCFYSMEHVVIMDVLLRHNE